MYSPFSTLKPQAQQPPKPLAQQPPKSKPPSYTTEQKIPTIIIRDGTLRTKLHKVWPKDVKARGIHRGSVLLQFTEIVHYRQYQSYLEENRVEFYTYKAPNTQERTIMKEFSTGMDTEDIKDCLKRQ